MKKQEAVVISCGKLKRFTTQPIEAKLLYVGTYFKISYKYAEFLNKDSIYIFSAKYGIIKDTEKIITYNESFKINTFSLDMKVLEKQVNDLHLKYNSIVYILGSSYLKKISIRNTDIVLFKNMGIGNRQKAMNDYLINKKQYIQEEMFN